MFYFVGHNQIRYRTFVLGNDYIVYYPRRTAICRFIKVTRKGFNFVDLTTSRCIFKRHVYAPKYSHMEIPTKETIFKVSLTGYMDMMIRDIPKVDVS